MWNDLDGTPRERNGEQGADSVDVVERVPDVQRSKPAGHDLPAQPVATELRALVLKSESQFKDLVQRYSAIRVEHKLPTSAFATALADRTSWFAELVDGGGLIFLTSVIPEWRGLLHIAFWDGKIPAKRRHAILNACATAMRFFELRRIDCHIPEQNKPLQVVVKKIGFREEGRIRQGYLSGTGYSNLHIYGILPEDIQWRTVAVGLTTSSA
jgi:hypothetical protein